MSQVGLPDSFPNSTTNSFYVLIHSLVVKLVEPTTRDLDPIFAFIVPWFIVLR
jgi:hypothetical protein